MAEKPPKLYALDDDEPAGALPVISPTLAPDPAVDPMTPARGTDTPDDERDNRGDGEVRQGEAVGMVQQQIAARNSRPVSQDEGTLLTREAARTQQRNADLLAALVPQPPFWTRWLSSVGLRWTLVLIATCLLLFALTQCALLFSHLAMLPPALRYVGYAGAGVLLAAVVMAMGRLIQMYSKLRRSPRLQTDTLYALAARQQLQAAYLQQAFDYVYEALHPLVVGYPLSDAAFVRQLKTWGMTSEQVATLTSIQHKLVTSREPKPAWIEEYNTRFLSLLDAVATRRVHRAAFTVGQLTAVSPRGMLDTLIVSALAVDLVRDLCLIYNLRANRVDTVRILATVLVNAGVASQADDLTQSLADQLCDMLQRDTSWLTALFGKIAAPLASGVADGVINGSLLARLGRLTIRAVRPLQA